MRHWPKWWGFSSVPKQVRTTVPSSWVMEPWFPAATGWGNHFSSGSSMKLKVLKEYTASTGWLPLFSKR